MTAEMSVEMIPVGIILPNPEQPRKQFDPSELNGLMQSIRENGLINAITVEGPYAVKGKSGTKDSFILIDGERRLKATKLAGMSEIRAEIRPPMKENIKQNRLILATVANLQRSDLNPIEEAQAFQQLHDLGFSHTQIANKMGICYARVACRIKLLELDEPIQREIEKGRLSKDGQVVNALLSITDKSIRVNLAKRLADRNASIKATVEACKRTQEHINSEKFSNEDNPGLKLTYRKTGEVNRPVYDALAAVGQVPPWILVEVCTKEVCDNCGLRDSASESICKGCAMVEMLTRMIKGTK